MNNLTVLAVCLAMVVGCDGGGDFSGVGQAAGAGGVLQSDGSALQESGHGGKAGAAGVAAGAAGSPMAGAGGAGGEGGEPGSEASADSLQPGDVELQESSPDASGGAPEAGPEPQVEAAAGAGGAGGHVSMDAATDKVVDACVWNPQPPCPVQACAYTACPGCTNTITCSSPFCECVRVYCCYECTQMMEGYSSAPYSSCLQQHQCGYCQS